MILVIRVRYLLLHACVSNNGCRLYDPLPELTPLSHLMFIVYSGSLPSVVYCLLLND